ncbi:MAG: hypothetical protein HJJLKODD_02929 [Phycisphaerae bacterium]|nr:hypothetical protein [Phycisphaerae bacterium]
MADISTGAKIRISPTSDIYTMLLIIATLFLLAGTVFLAMRNQELFGSWMPLG